MATVMRAWQAPVGAWTQVYGPATLVNEEIEIQNDGNCPVLVNVGTGGPVIGSPALVMQPGEHRDFTGMAIGDVVSVMPVYPSGVAVPLPAQNVTVWSDV